MHKSHIHVVSRETLGLQEQLGLSENLELETLDQR